MTKFAKSVGTKFKTLVLALALIVACAFVFSACGSSGGNKNTGDPATISEQTVVDQIASLNNSTTTITISYDVSKSVSATSSASVNGELDEITINRNGAKYAITSPNVSMYADGMNFYSYSNYSDDPDAGVWQYAGFIGIDSYLEEISAMLPTKQEFAGYYQQIVSQLASDNYSVVYAENNGKKVSFKIDLASAYTAVIESLIDYKNVTIGAMINEVISSVAGTPIDLSSNNIAGTNMSLAQIVSSMVSEETTFGGIVDLISATTGISFE